HALPVLAGVGLRAGVAVVAGRAVGLPRAPGRADLDDLRGLAPGERTVAGVAAEHAVAVVALDVEAPVAVLHDQAGVRLAVGVAVLDGDHVGGFGADGLAGQRRPGAVDDRDQHGLVHRDGHGLAVGHLAVPGLAAVEHGVHDLRLEREPALRHPD